MATYDEQKGKIKEAAGEVTGDDEMRRSGKMDQAAGKAKDAVDAVRDKAGEVLLSHDVEACRAYRVREWLKIHCAGFSLKRPGRVLPMITFIFIFSIKFLLIII